MMGMSNEATTLNEEKIILKANDFEEILGETLSVYVKERIAEYGLSYTNLKPDEHDACIRTCVDVLLGKRQIDKAGNHSLEKWERGWSENLKELTSNGALKSVIPRYFGKYSAARWKQRFIRPVSQDYEYRMLGVILDWLFDKYMKNTKNIYEFGCGTGYNLLRLRKINPDANLWGLDWTEASQQIIARLALEIDDPRLFAHRFDYYVPDKSFILEKDSMIYTVASLEQVGGRFRQFIHYLLKNKPRLCVHIEPVAELLNEEILLDYLSIQYFKKRNYLNGFLDYLYKLERKGDVKVLMARRTYTGSLFIEGHSVVVWEPL